MLSADFYQDPDTLKIARELLGKQLVTRIDGFSTAGIIVETEAYCGAIDKGSHAFGLRRTPRTETMFQSGGITYIYLCYGIHQMLNVVTGPEDDPQAVLIRAACPTIGIDVMRQRRGLQVKEEQLCRGPGSLAKAFGLSRQHNALPLDSDLIFIEEPEKPFSGEISSGPRIGIAYAGEFVEKPWRFYFRGNPCVSKPNR